MVLVGESVEDGFSIDSVLGEDWSLAQAGGSTARWLVMRTTRGRCLDCRSGHAVRRSWWVAMTSDTSTLATFAPITP